MNWGTEYYIKWAIWFQFKKKTEIFSKCFVGHIFPQILSMDTIAVINTGSEWPSQAPTFNWLYSVESFYLDFMKEVISLVSIFAEDDCFPILRTCFHKIALWIVVVFHSKHFPSPSLKKIIYGINSQLAIEIFFSSSSLCSSSSSSSSYFLLFLLVGGSFIQPIHQLV